MEPRKQAIMVALDKFVGQRPGLEFGNYGDVSACHSEMRSIARDRHDYNALARAVERSDSITADMLLKASESAFSGRLTINEPPRAPMEGLRARLARTGEEHLQHILRALINSKSIVGVRIDYTTGQYFPTEYRKAAAAVLAAALWAHVREQCMPAPFTPPLCEGNWYKPPYANGPNWKPVSAGDWLSAYFRREFGRSIANRWFS